MPCSVFSTPLVSPFDPSAVCWPHCICLSLLTGRRQHVHLSPLCPFMRCLSACLSDVHWSVRRNKRSVCLSCHVSRLLVLPWGVCMPGRLGLSPSRNSCSWDAFPGQSLPGAGSRPQASLRCSVVNRQEMTGSQGQSFLERPLKTPHPRGKVMCKLRSGSVKQLRKKWDLETGRRWLLLFQLTEGSNFKPGCSWSSCKKGKKPEKNEGGVDSLSCHTPLWKCQWLFSCLLRKSSLSPPCE